MRPRWPIRSRDTSRLWAVACLALVSSGAGRSSEAASAAPPFTADAGIGSAHAGWRGTPPEAVVAAQRVAEAEARAREEALPVLRLAALGVGTRLDLRPFGPDGEPRQEAMDQIARALAPRSRKVSKDVAPLPIDPRLVALLIRISSELGDAPLTIVSGHREPGRGTSRKSFHVRGMAVDIAAPGKKPRDIRDAAIRAGAGGVGLYRGFVHVDVRDEPYRWGGGGRSARRAR